VLSSHVGESPRRAATINFVTTFFDPATSISPLSGPFGSMAQARATFTAQSWHGRLLTGANLEDRSAG
jgi:hypothetical protein